jgi:hypothetical protein
VRSLDKFKLSFEKRTLLTISSCYVRLCGVHERGFRQQTCGHDAGAFSHPLFRRDEPEKCLEMECDRSGKLSRDRNEVTHLDGLVQPSAGIKTFGSTGISADQTPKSYSFELQPALKAEAENSVSDAAMDESFQSRSNTLPRFLVHANMIESVATANTAFARRLDAQRAQDERLRLARIMLFENYLRVATQQLPLKPTNG